MITLTVLETEKPIHIFEPHIAAVFEYKGVTNVLIATMSPLHVKETVDQVLEQL